jgi:hypothetical protein
MLKALLRVRSKTNRTRKKGTGERMNDRPKMNQRLSAIKQQAHLYALDQEWYIDSFEQRFAELIVQECADLYNHEDVLAPIGMSARGEAHQHGWIEGTKTYRDTILEHFGVEE